MTYRITDPRAGSQPIANTSTTQLHPLGTIIRATDPTYGEGEFIYLTGIASTVVGSWVTYLPDDWDTALIVADAIGQVAIAMSINDAVTDYGWYQISGKAVAGSATASADNGLVWIAASNTVDDVSVAGDLVNLARFAETISGATVLTTVEIHRPWVNDFSNSS